MRTAPYIQISVYISLAKNAITNLDIPNVWRKSELKRLSQVVTDSRRIDQSSRIDLKNKWNAVKYIFFS